MQDEITLIESGKNHRSKLNNLSPVIDNNGILRAEGRLELSDLPYDKKHQIILPYNHHVTSILIQAIHRENAHIGQSGLLAMVRQRYWPVRGKQLIRKIVHNCVICFKSNPRDIKLYMGQLPKSRVTPGFPFENVGINYVGPILIKQTQRKAAPVKAYIAIFVCMATKAIHIELVANLTASAFIGSLQRFISRRGVPARIFSDNGTTFVGAKHDLAELRSFFKNQNSKEKIEDFCALREIEWSFIPLRSPHFG